MLTFVPTPIGNLQDITFRAIEAFKKAELFLCEDTRVAKQLLRLLNEKITTIEINARFLSFNEHNGKERLSQIGSELKSLNAIYVSDAGTPSISDPGLLLVEFCQENGINYDVLPGATAVTTVYSASGFGNKFTFWGFLPHKNPKRDEELREILSNQTDTIIYESPHRLLKLLQEITQKDPTREIFLAKELTKKHQRYFRGSVKSLYEKLKDANIKGEWALVIKRGNKKEQNLPLEEILHMDIPPKIKAKILSKMTKVPTKEWYKRLIDS